MEISRYLAKTKKLLLVFPTLFLLEVVLGESGRWLEIGGFRLRFFLFGLTIISLYAYAALSWRSLRFARIDLAVLFFLAINAIWGLLVPVLYDRSLGLSLGDFNTVSILLLYFPMVAVLRANESLWWRTKIIFVAAASLFAFAHVVAGIIGFWSTGTGHEVRELVRNIYNDPTLFVGDTANGIFRIALASAILLIPVFFTISGLLVRGYRPKLMIFLIFVVSCGFVIVGARTFWVAIAFGLIVAGIVTIFRWIARREYRNPLVFFREISPVLIFVAAFLFMAVVNSSTEYLHTVTSEQSAQQDPDSQNQDTSEQDGSLANRATSTFDPQDPSVSTKLGQLTYLIDEWREAPILGQGFGASAEEYEQARPDRGAPPYLFELTAPSLLMKLGVVGSLLWLAPLVYILAEAVRYVRSWINASYIRFAIAGLMSFALAVQANPWLYNFVGMCVLLYYLLELGSTKYGYPYLSKMSLPGWLASGRAKSEHQFEGGG